MAEGFGNFENTSGRKSRVRIEEGEKLGEGSMAEVHEVNARVQSADKERKMSTLVVKKYRDDLKLADEAAERSLKNYEHLKRLNFPVPPTYRLDRENKRILMTNLKTLFPNSVNISTSQSEEAKGFFIDHLSNLEDITRKMLYYAETAAAHGIDLGFDAYNLIVPKSGTGEGRIYFTDLEMIDKVENNSEDEKRQVLRENIKCAKEFLETFVVLEHVQETDRAQYLSTIASIFNERKQQLGLSDS